MKTLLLLINVNDYLVEEISNFHNNTIEIHVQNLEKITNQNLWFSILAITEVAIKKSYNEYSIMIGEHDSRGENICNYLLHFMGQMKFRSDLHLHNLCDFKYAVPITKNCFWIDKFTRSSFFTVKKNLFETISKVRKIKISESPYKILSSLSPYKTTGIPFVVTTEEISDRGIQKLMNIRRIVQQLYSE